MASPPCPPCTLKCPWCDWSLLIFARGARGKDPGSGVQAGELAKRHAREVHGRPWKDFLAASAQKDVECL